MHALPTHFELELGSMLVLATCPDGTPGGAGAGPAGNSGMGWPPGVRLRLGYIPKGT